MFFVTNCFSRKESNLPSAFFISSYKSEWKGEGLIEYTTNKGKHIRSFVFGYNAKTLEKFYGNEASFFFEAPYYDSYDGYKEESDFVPDRIVDCFGRTVLSL